MAKLFQTNPQTVADLLSEIAKRAWALPQFQRDFKWEPEKTASLLASLMARYPAGSLLVWQPKVIEIEAREIEDAPKLNHPLEPGQPEVLILDGQQRLTALYRSLRGKAAEKYF